MTDTISINEMTDTNTVILIDKDHKVIIVQTNSEDISVHSVEEARALGESLIAAADHIQPKQEKKESKENKEPVKLVPKTA